jgi:S-adenosylmethionine-diacylglycerol 3-amino-3-carboxypropyl transferase
LEDQVSFRFIRYANCWEDADVLCEALQPGPGRRVLSIASAGDNCLALAAEGAEVVAADLSAAQLACLELRRAAFRRLSYEQVLEFLGVSPSTTRLATYDRLASDLPPHVQAFWSKNHPAIANGLIHAGKLETYFRLFRRRVLPLIHSQRTVARLLEARDLDARREFWDRWNNRRWRLLFRFFFSRRLMGWLGRDPEFFRYVEGNVAERFMQRAHYGLTELPTHSNPFLHYIAQGNFGPSLPRYLRPEHFQNVRAGLDRLTLHHGAIEHAARQYGQDGYDALNLSDIFEYLAPDVALRTYQDLIAHARPGARLAYWNTLVPRGRPAELAARVRPLGELAATLHRRDQVFFYGAFHVDEVSA